MPVLNASSRQRRGLEGHKGPWVTWVCGWELLGTGLPWSWAHCPGAVGSFANARHFSHAHSV